MATNFDDWLRERIDVARESGEICVGMWEWSGGISDLQVAKRFWQLLGDEFVECSCITFIDCSNACFTVLWEEDCARAVTNLQRLTALEVASSRVSDEGVKALAKLYKPEELKLYGPRVSNVGVKALATLDKLKRLEFGASSLGDEGVKALATFEKLEILDLTNTLVSDEGVKALAK